MYKIFRDYLWGEIKVEDPFLQIIEWPEITALKQKHQLGIIIFNDNYLGGKHNRFEHSLGVFHLTQVLINIFNDKFGDIFEITTREENILKLLALFHDTGHGPYSHSFEHVTHVSHEQATREIILSVKDRIDNLFDSNTTSDLLELFDNRERIKNSKMSYKSHDTDFNILIAFIDLLAGAVDVDRIDYIARDSFNICGQAKDFSMLLQYINLDVVNGKPQIVFESNAIELLEDYFLARFRMYFVYFAKETLIKEHLFKKFVTETFDKDSISFSLTEADINKKIFEASTQDTYLARFANCIINPFSEDFLHKSFTSEKELNLFTTSLDAYIELNTLYFGQTSRTITVYDSSKNQLFIRDSHGETEDLAMVSEIIKDKISKKLFVCYVDTHLLSSYLINEKHLLPFEASSIVKNVFDLFNASKYEIEKKITVSSATTLQSVFEQFQSNYVDTIANSTSIANTDIYFETGTTNVSARVRKADGLTTYTIKARLKDESSLTKRIEKNYNNITEDAFLAILNENLDFYSCKQLSELKKQYSIETFRKKEVLQFSNGATIEVCFDSSKYSNLVEEKEDYMIEFELISGNPVQLLVLYNKIFKYNATYSKPCNESKLQRCMKFLERK